VRFVIADPSLKDTHGHHHALTMRITASARVSGLRPVWFCHRDASLDETAGAEALPVFSVSLYDAYRRGSPSARAGLIDRVRRLWRRMQPAQSPDNILSAQLSQAIKRTGLGRDDRILFHTADGMTFGAIDRLYSLADAEELPRIHVCTPYDPKGIMPNRLPDRPIDQIVNRWRARGLIGRKIFLHGENARLAAHLASLWGVSVHPLPLPALPPDPIVGREGAAAWPVNHPDVLKVIVLGPARVEKGFHLLPDIVRHTLDALGASPEAGARAPVCFAFHCAPQVIGYAPQVLKALERLKEFPPGIVHLIEGDLSESAYLAWAASSDLFLLPYGQREYALRSSGIVTEALSMNKIIVATADTYPASAIGRNAGLAAGTPAEFGRAIAEVSREIRRFREGARLSGERFRSEHPAEKYVSRCLDAEVNRGNPVVPDAATGLPA